MGCSIIFSSTQICNFRCSCLLYPSYCSQGPNFKDLEGLIVDETNVIHLDPSAKVKSGKYLESSSVLGLHLTLNISVD